MVAKEDHETLSKKDIFQYLHFKNMQHQNHAYANILEEGKRIIQLMNGFLRDPKNPRGNRIEHLTLTQNGIFENRFRYFSQLFLIRVELKVPIKESAAPMGELCLYEVAYELGHEKLISFDAFYDYRGFHVHTLMYHPRNGSFLAFGPENDSKQVRTVEEDSRDLADIPLFVIESIHDHIDGRRVVPQHMDK